MKDDTSKTTLYKVNIAPSFGKSIKKLRSDNSITMEQLAKSSGVSQSYISQLENDTRVPSKDTVHKLAHAFFSIDNGEKKINENDLFKKLWKAKEISEVKKNLELLTVMSFANFSDSESSEKVTLLMETVNKLTSNQLKEVYDFARFLLESDNE